MSIAVVALAIGWEIMGAVLLSATGFCLWTGIPMVLAGLLLAGPERSFPGWLPHDGRRGRGLALGLMGSGICSLAYFIHHPARHHPAFALIPSALIVGGMGLNMLVLRRVQRLRDAALR